MVNMLANLSDAMLAQKTRITSASVIGTEDSSGTRSYVAHVIQITTHFQK